MQYRPSFRSLSGRCHNDRIRYIAKSPCVLTHKEKEMNMNISGEIIKKLRIERSWTQEHLAAIASVSARTIQRVEKTVICDLETRSALASVFQVDVTQLDGEKKIEQTKPTPNTNPLYFSRVKIGRA